MGRAMYLIGPSNVGKTSAARPLAERGLVELVELDEVVRRIRPDVSRIVAAQDWDGVVQPLLSEYERSESEPPLLVDIGAGTQDLDRELHSPYLSQFLRRHRRRVILAEGDLDRIFARSRVHTDRGAFDRLECAPERLEVYASADHRLWFSDGDIESATADLADAIGRICGKA